MGKQRRLAPRRRVKPHKPKIRLVLRHRDKRSFRGSCARTQPMERHQRLVERNKRESGPLDQLLVPGRRKPWRQLREQ